VKINPESRGTRGSSKKCQEPCRIGETLILSPRLTSAMKRSQPIGFVPRLKVHPHTGRSAAAAMISLG